MPTTRALRRMFPVGTGTTMDERTFRLERRAGVTLVFLLLLFSVQRRKVQGVGAGRRPGNAMVARCPPSFYVRAMCDTPQWFS